MAKVERLKYEDETLKLGHNVVLGGVVKADAVKGAIVSYVHADDNWVAATAASTGALGVVAEEASAGEEAAIIVAGVVSGVNVKGINPEMYGKLLLSSLYVAEAL